MKNYVIVTESTTDLTQDLVNELGIKIIPMVFGFENESYLNYPDNREMDIHKFYERVKAGERSTTALINSKTFEEYFEPILKSGDDILYIGFSSGLSGTYNSSLIAAEELKQKYPDSKIVCIDTLAASMGEGLLVYHAVKLKQQGKDIEQVSQWLMDNRLKLNHWFTVDDLNHLRRGGRISAMTATIGSALNVKPILHVDNEGHLIPVHNVRGRKKSINALLEHMEELSINPQEQTIFISHANCLEDAENLANLIRKKLKIKEIILNFIGPVIGSHTGQGTIALFFIGKER
jgi:DegV family protein with EDD domain